MELDSLKDIQSGAYIVKHPTTGKDTDATITLAGPEHPLRQKIVMDRSRRIRAAVRKTGKLDVPDPTEEREEETATLAACTLGWTGLTKTGAPLEFSPTAAAALYRDPELQWLRAQIAKALDDMELFISDSAKT